MKFYVSVWSGLIHALFLPLALFSNVSRGITYSSRLGCQIKVREDFEGMTVRDLFAPLIDSLSCNYIARHLHHYTMDGARPHSGQNP